MQPSYYLLCLIFVFILHVYRTIEVLTAGLIRTTAVLRKEYKIWEYHAIAYVFLHFWYKYELRK